MFLKGTSVALMAIIFIGLICLFQPGTEANSGHPSKRHSNGKQSNSRGVSKPVEASTKLDKQVESARVKAASDWRYVCCIKPGCSWCVIHLGKCVCYMGVGSGKTACRECHGGWEAGQGCVPGKTKEDVREMKTFTTSAEMEE